MASEKGKQDEIYTPTPYDLLVRKLYTVNLFHPVKMGLKSIEQLHKALGNPMDDPNITIIHVAGTNGKGSVSLKIAKSLELAGHKVGLFVSPHVASFRERMQINSQIMSEEDVISRLSRVFAVMEEHDIPATFFEVTSALAFLHFAESKVDVVVLETGLGGRLDATNIVKSPSISIITSIGLEHTQILGDTVELIAKEKGGIIKPGRPVLVGPNVPHEVLRQCAEEKAASGYYTVEDILGIDEVMGAGKKFMVGSKVLHDYDKENARIAKAALLILQRQQQNGETTNDNISFQRRHIGPITTEQIEEGTSHRPPCRFEEFSVKNPQGGEDGNNSITVILDVAHNPPAMEHLVAKLGATHPTKAKRFVVGFSSDKDLAKCSQLLLSIAPDPSNLHVVEASNPRAAKLEAILKAEPRLRDSNFDQKDRSITAQVKYALELTAEKDEVLVVCGSVFLMAEARKALGYDEPRDSDCISEMSGCHIKPQGQENFGNTDVEKAAMKAVSDGK
mmetsp:Transcript_37519/g.57199  ORF Transcript_37519/g.57199 Transcript_37519/m.57199 type:complete len:506 (+) Transcript_37519:42-1559(+)